MKLRVVGQDKCGGCEDLLMYLEEEHEDLEFEHVNLSEMTSDEQDKYTEEHNIGGIPSTILLNEDGEELERFVGFEEGSHETHIDRLVARVK